MNTRPLFYTRRRWRAAALALTLTAAAAGVAAYFLLGMPGMDHSAGVASDSGARSSDATWRVVGVDAFAREVDGEAVVINVHVPDEGSIPGTDVTIPFDQLVDRPQLAYPVTARIALYCRTGRMSNLAAQALVRAGYLNVVELEGGMDAWKRDGRPLN